MKHTPKHQHMTISIPEDVKRNLYLHVKPRERSRFIAKAIEERLDAERDSLDKQYKLAAQDDERNREFKEWENVMIEDGLNENNDW